MLKAAYAVLVAGVAALTIFAASYFGPRGLTVLRFSLLGAIPLLVFAGVLYLLSRRFGPGSAAAPGLLGSIVLIVTGAGMYSVAIRPFQPGHDEFEPNLVFLFAPLHLFEITLVVSLIALGWAWIHRAREL